MTCIPKVGILTTKYHVPQPLRQSPTQIMFAKNRPTRPQSGIARKSARKRQAPPSQKLCGGTRTGMENYPGKPLLKWQNKACHSCKLPLRFGANRFGPCSMRQQSVGKRMTKARRDGLVLLFLGASILVLLMTYLVNSTSTAAFEDFKPDYYASRCLIEHGDPYNELRRPTRLSGRRRRAPARSGNGS